MEYLDADKLARVLGRGRSTAHATLTTIAAAHPDAVIDEGEGRTARRLVAVTAVAAHLRLDVADVLLLAA